MASGCGGRLDYDTAHREDRQVLGEPQVDPFLQDFFEFLAALLAGIGVGPDALEPRDFPYQVPSSSTSYLASCIAASM
ncbi:MAG: hypothetical protein AVDCRST_MAG28-2049 [uncultured Rubrobacteraceae bacterium]|uniref:Uncharacterized protein n=1 Tax=uncultured Rubrobacteraceae bacterium TaxID=349277 RepID=A0A6J4QTR4_9ACTN|nr:MAG: hypothetical protein AVDCRST_MAG28-2049 [uncultured Rubrobacteraceae bacterium]